mgnify:CR=1 FL=1
MRKKCKHIIIIIIITVKLLSYEYDLVSRVIFRIKLESHTKLSCTEYVTAFLKLHGLLHSNTELETAEKLVQVLTTSLTAHIATESLTSWKLVQVPRRGGGGGEILGLLN